MLVRNIPSEFPGDCCQPSHSEIDTSFDSECTRADVNTHDLVTPYTCSDIKIPKSRYSSRGTIFTSLPVDIVDLIKLTVIHLLLRFAVKE